MGLPIYNQINIKSSSIDELHSILSPDLNLKHPVVLNLKNFSLEEQREMIGLIENYYFTANISYHFPYPVYMITDHEKSLTNMALIKDIEELPKFFNQKEGKINVKESHVIGRNKLLQTEIKNTDADFINRSVASYGESHRKIYELERECQFYKSILNKLTRANRHG